jgi:hypothetical protein
MFNNYSEIEEKVRGSIIYKSVLDKEIRIGLIKRITDKIWQKKN